MMNSQTDDRISYWDGDYYKYWKERTAESNESLDGRSRLNKNDSLSSSDQDYIDAIDLLNLASDMTALEVGVGFGRSIPHLSKLVGRLHAIDISSRMIEAAREMCRDIPNAEFHVSSAELTPFAAESFDAVICFAVFDALYQDKALLEMLRVAKPGAQLLLTGKNDNYHDDDDEAALAEQGARNKGHPNYFTDVKGLLGQLDALGLRLLDACYFSRRGDFHRRLGSAVAPEKFYEYRLVLEKIPGVTPRLTQTIAAAYSKTWGRLHPDEA